MSWKSSIAPAALLLLLCAACNNAKYKEASTSAAEPALARESAARADSASVATDNEDFKQQGPGAPAARATAAAPAAPAPNPDWDRKIVKTADLALQVKNFEQFSDRLHASVRQSGGYIASEQQSQDAGQIENTVAIRVPVDRFEELMVQLPGDSDKLETKKVSSDDVTMELIDTKSRLETKKEVRERYLELLRQAHSMKDIITVQNEINDIQGEMDQAAGRIAWLGHSSAYSTINLHFFQILDETVRPDAPPGFMQQLKESIGEGWKGLSAFLIGVISAWPLWIALGFGIVWIRKVMRRVKTAAAVVTTGSAPVKETT
jgi:hypothetical protein